MESSSASLVTKGTQPWTTRGREHEFNRGGAGDKRQDTEKLEASREHWRECGVRPLGETVDGAPVLNVEPSRDPEPPPKHLPRDVKTCSRRSAAPGGSLGSARSPQREGPASTTDASATLPRPPRPPSPGLGSRVRLTSSTPNGSPATSLQPVTASVWPGSWPSTAWRRLVTCHLQRDAHQVAVRRKPTRASPVLRTGLELPVGHRWSRPTDLLGLLGPAGSEPSTLWLPSTLASGRPLIQPAPHPTPLSAPAASSSRPVRSSLPAGNLHRHPHSLRHSRRPFS
ncbi:wiskott-Aldrich syndrome protein family member 1-like [Pteropus medius]|uniref:wiskott-Aldrich syndrome protein family member 1-like n=1 Tax=Pteropus vampyrus TaxID=132908 RepID=UPI00196A5156|nr:wiskott-Aldrich syndrome protein family member 1-like [Pteropus giganteus]